MNIDHVTSNSDEKLRFLEKHKCTQISRIRGMLPNDWVCLAEKNTKHIYMYLLFITKLHMKYYSGF